MTETNAVQKDYHGHPNYLAVYLALVAILVASIAVGEFFSKKLGVALIFGLAILKALLVLGNFMHLRWEPKLVWGVGGIALFWVLVFYGLVLPDIVPVAVHIAK